MVLLKEPLLRGGEGITVPNPWGLLATATPGVWEGLGLYTYITLNRR